MIFTLGTLTLPAAKASSVNSSDKSASPTSSKRGKSATRWGNWLSRLSNPKSFATEVGIPPADAVVTPTDKYSAAACVVMRTPSMTPRSSVYSQTALAAVSSSTPFGRRPSAESGSLTMTPPEGSGVDSSIPKISSPTVFTTARCPETCAIATGRLVEILSRSSRVGWRFSASSVSSYPWPTTQPSRLCLAKALRLPSNPSMSVTRPMGGLFKSTEKTVCPEPGKCP